MQTPVFNESIGNFSNIIGIVFNNWTALKLAVEHGMGGPPVDTTRKLNAMVETVSEMILAGSCEWTELSDVLSDVMDLEFSTVLEDGSNDEVAVHLLQFHKMFSDGNFQALMSACDSLPFKFPIHLSPPVQRISNHNQSHPSDEEQESDTNGQNHIEEDDGWTVVKRK